MSGLNEHERKRLSDSYYNGAGFWDLTRTVDTILAARTEQARPEHVVKAALEEAAAEMDAFADESYGPDIFRRPTSDEYAEINALLKKERGHQLDGIAADVMSRAIKGRADWLRDRADALERQP